MKTSSLNLVVIMLFQLTEITAHAQTIWTVTGTVRDASTNDLLSGTSISVQHKTTGTITDQLGHFQIQIPESKEAVLLLISYVGYETQKIEVTGGSTNIDIKMTKNQQLAKEVVVTASRISETILEAPVTILKMDANAVKETPSENFYASLSGYKGVDVITNSILYKTINTRGFNNNANFRLAQLIDGVDNSLPGLGWPLGNVLGATDLDVEKVELVPGPASALYGANAFNGLLSVTT
ncbi:MAG: carboxypeptidase-like regulatory domain-containing protein, partial [Chitinophagales bacterium]